MRILTIEDDARISKYLKRSLEHEGFEVVECHDGRKGLEIAQKKSFDLILVDVLLPNIDGFTIISKLREVEISIPIIALTAKSSVEDKVTGLTIGADDYVTKPFIFAELIARINALLRRTEKYTLSRIALGNIVLDTDQQILYKNKKQIKLTRKEYLLLKYFMTNPNTILSRQDIVDNIWKIAENSSKTMNSNIIDVYVKKIRAKIEADDDKPNPTIKSIREVGYKLIVEEEEI